MIDYFVSKVMTESFICLSWTYSFSIIIIYYKLLLSLLLSFLFLFLFLFSSSSLSSEESTFEDTSLIVSSIVAKRF
jgi:hypothetical protein